MIRLLVAPTFQAARDYIYCNQSEFLDGRRIQLPTIISSHQDCRRIMGMRIIRDEVKVIERDRVHDIDAIEREIAIRIYDEPDLSLEETTALLDGLLRLQFRLRSPAWR